MFPCRSLLAAATVVILLTIQPVNCFASSEQVVFSGAALNGTFDGQPTPLGFWIWCEADSTNSYAGKCNGALRFDALAITQHVTGTITEISEDHYQITVGSASTSCVFTNTGDLNHGPRTLVEITCFRPAGATSVLAVVNITGK
jgi:hypothetical protein